MNHDCMSDTRHVSIRLDLSKRFTSSRFGTFVCAAPGVHATAGQGRVRTINRACSVACVARMDVRETLRMCNADPEQSDTSEFGPFRTDDGDRRFDLRGNACAANDARQCLSRSCIEQGGCDSSHKPPAVRRTRDRPQTACGRTACAYADSSVNQNTSPRPRLRAHLAPGPLRHGASRPMAHALLNVGQVRPEALARQQQTDGDANATKPGGDATRPPGRTTSALARRTGGRVPLTTARSPGAFSSHRSSSRTSGTRT